VVEQADIVANQGCILEGRVCFYADHGNRVVQDHGVESMNCIQGKAVQMDSDGGDGGSHNQEVFGWRPKT